MPILEITDTHVVQHCAGCSTTRELPLQGLFSMEDSQSLENGVLSLPACVCGSTEFLIRAPDDEPPHPAPGSTGHLHRMVVDALVDEVRERLKGDRTTKRFVVAMSARIGSEVASRWFPGGIKIEDRTRRKDPNITNEAVA